MIWTIRLCFMLALTSLSGTFAYLAWKICQVYLQRRKMLRWIYPMLAMVEPFFVLPFVCGMASMFQKETGASMTIGYALMGDRNVYLLCTSLSLVWAGGACFYLLRYVRTSWRVYWRLWRTRVPAEAGVQRLADEIRARLGIRQQIRVYVSPVMWTPMVINGLHKWILLPEQDWDRRELEVILCHELTHVKQRIIPLKAVGSLMRIVYWFTPVSHLYLDALDEWGETACDLSVRYDAGCVADFREYFFAVLAGVRMADDEPAGWTQFAKVKGVEKRIMRISKYERERDLRPVVGVALMVAFCLT